MKQALVFLALACAFSPAAISQQNPTSPLPASAEKARVFITESQSWEMRSSSGGSQHNWGSSSSGGARPQTAEIIKTFGERCPTVMINNIQDNADFIVLLDHEGGKGVLRHKNKVAVFERVSGDTVVSKSTLSLGGAVQDACDAISQYWIANGARLLAAKSAREKTVATVSTPASAISANARLAVASQPEGADIEIDGSFVGSTPSTIELQAGEHTAVVHKKGFQNWQRKITVTGGTINLRAELEPLP